MTHRHRRLWGLICIVLIVFVGVVYAQDDDGGEPIAPGATFTPTPQPTQTAIPTTPTTPTTPTLQPTVTPSATTTPLTTAAPTRSDTTPASTAPDIPRGVVAFNSAFIRELPAPDAAAVASTFRDDQLEIIGRNADGTWVEVRRPFRDESLGWIAIDLLEYDVLPEILPLTDITTRVTGDTPISTDATYAVFINEGVALRTLPNRQQGERILNIPPSVTVPVTGRYRDGAWLRVNYLGTEGWIIGFVIRARDDILTVPEIRGILPDDNAPEVSAFIVPPEVQLAKLEEIRAYTEPRLVVAADLANFWFLVQRGEVLPCNPPPTVDEYRYGGGDVRILPEIDRYAPRLNEGVGYLNTSIAVLNRCGVVDPFDVNDARNDAVNAKLILENTLVQLDNLERIIR